MPDLLVNPSPSPDEEAAKPLLVNSPGEPMLSSSVAEERATKYDTALGEDSPGLLQLHNDLQVRREQNYRDYVAKKEAIRIRGAQLEMVDAISQGQATPATLNQIDTLTSLKPEEMVNPETIVEKVYARKALGQNLWAGENLPMYEGLQADPEGVHRALDGGEQILMLKEGLQRIHEDLQARSENQTGLESTVDFLDSWVPTETWRQISSATEGIPTSGASGPGFLIQDVKNYITSLPPEKAITEAKRIIDMVADHNVETAMQLSAALISYTSTQQFMDTLIIGGGDIASLGGAAKGIAKVAGKVAKGVRTAGAAKEVKGVVDQGLKEAGAPDALSATPLQRAQTAVKDTVSGLLKPKTDPVEVLDSAGRNVDAGISGAIKRFTDIITKNVQNLGENAAFQQIRSEAPMIFNTESWVSLSSKYFSTEAQRRIVNELLGSTPEILKTMFKGGRIERLNMENEEVVSAMALQAWDNVAKEYFHHADSIIDAIPEVKKTAAGDVYNVRVLMGDDNGALFDHQLTANNRAVERGLQSGDYTIQQQGSGYYIQLNRTVDETDSLIRNLDIETDHITPKGSLATRFFGLLRTPEETLSKIARLDRKTAQGGIGEMNTMIQASAERIGQVPKKGRRELFKFIEADRIYESTRTVGGQELRNPPGRFASTLSEFEGRWVEMFGVAPSEKQVIAYGEYVRLNELDWVMRNSRIYRDKARLGFRDWKVGGIEGVEGKMVDDIPIDAADDAGILIITKDGREMLSKNANREGLKARVTELQAKGARIVHVTPQGERALQADEAVSDLIGKEKVHFVITDDFASKNLSLHQLPNRPGGHIIVKDGFYLGQAKITRTKSGANRYDGDVNILSANTEAKARKLATHYEKVRQMLRDAADEADIDNYIRKNLGKSPEQVKKLFVDDVDPRTGKLKEAYLSLTEPITVRGKGERIGDVEGYKTKYANFQDSREDPYNLYSDVNLEFAGSRNELIETARDIGTEDNPLFRFENAPLVDAMTALRRGVADMFKARFIDDLKTKEVENFIKEFGHTLDVAGGVDALRRNPLRHVLNPKWNEAANIDDLKAAQTSWLALKQFIGTDTPFARNLRFTFQKVMNSVYNKFGDKGVEFVRPIELFLTNDPLKYARGLAFHAKLGMLNPAQLFLQAQTFAHMTAIAGPRVAAKAGPGALLMHMLRYTDSEAIIDKFAEHAKAFGWRSDIFKEAYTELRNTGFDRVGKEVAMRDDIFDPAVVQTGAGKFLDWTTTFFTQGERFVRVSGYNAAFLEWRLANPTKKITEKVRAEILDRADLYSGNMTRASNATWQRGWASIPTQFFAYQARIAEQLWGKRLTGAEKARVMGMYSMLYGVPVAGSSATMVWPWGDTLRSHLTSMGIDYDDNVITDGLMNGFASVALEMLSGTQFNVGERYGPGGVDAFHDFLTGEKDGSELLLGVSGTAVADFAKSFYPVLTDVADIFRGDQEAYPLMMEDLVDFSKEFSSVNNLTKMIYGLNFGRYITKNEIYMTDVDDLTAVFMGLSGLSPQSVSDAFTKTQIMDAEDKYNQQAGKEAIKYIRRGLRAGDRNDRVRSFTRAKTWVESSGMTPKERARVYNQAMKNSQSFVNKTDWDFANSKPERMQQLLKEKTQ